MANNPTITKFMAARDAVLADADWPAYYKRYSRISSLVAADTGSKKRDQAYLMARFATERGYLKGI